MFKHITRVGTRVFALLGNSLHIQSRFGREFISWNECFPILMHIQAAEGVDTIPTQLFWQVLVAYLQTEKSLGMTTYRHYMCSWVKSDKDNHLIFGKNKFRSIYDF